MSHPWVVSDFDDCEIVAASFPKSKQIAVAGTKRPLSSLSQDFNKKAVISDKKCNVEVPWALKHCPKTVNDLIVAKAKVSELSNILSNVTEPRIILLLGPPGCGKSVAVRCVATSLGFRIREWIQPVSETRSYVDNKGDISEQFDGGICRNFSDFILNATSYESLTAASSSTVITIIEEMPMFKSELCPESMFHELLRQCAASLRNPICFVLTSNAASADPPELNRLFPQRLRDELRIYCLAFNPIPSRTLTKTLTTMAASENILQSLPANCINDIVETSEGDLRSAINSLQFSSHKVKNRQPESLSLSKRGAKERRMTPISKTKSVSKPTDDCSFSLTNFFQADLDTKEPHDSHSLLLFRALGRVLYCKRSSPEEMSKNSKSRITLPDHLKHFETDALTFDPVALFRHCPVTPATFVGFLNHNAPAFYSSIDDLAILNDRYLSICDLIFNQWDSSLENNCELGALLAVFATVNCNSSRRRFTEKDTEDLQSQSSSTQSRKVGGGGNHSFKPLHAPPVWNTRRCASERQKAARSILPDYLAVSSDNVIADYVSFARTTRSNNFISNRSWLRQLGSLGEVGRMQVRSTTITVGTSNYDEESVSENQNYIHSAADQQNKALSMPTEDEAECRAYNDVFLETIQEDDD